MYIAWHWIVFIIMLVGIYIYAIKHSCRAYRQDRDALLDIMRRWRERGPQGKSK